MKEKKYFFASLKSLKKGVADPKLDPDPDPLVRGRILNTGWRPWCCVQVDLLKDQVEEVEEQNSLILKELRAKSHDYELLKRDHEESKRAVQLLQAALQDHQAMVI